MALKTSYGFWTTWNPKTPESNKSEQILLSMVHSTVQDTSMKEDIGYEAIMGIIDRSIERKIPWEDVPR